MSLKVATLAVGTEVTDGQIVDRNSAILSQLSVDLGFSIVEHRAVPDDRIMISQALSELGSKVDILFVTGGLGPTSDDFTRELIAKHVGSNLEFNEESWQHVLDTLASRGVAPRDAQRQQCFFPPQAKIYKNPAGTANAFSVSKGNLKIVALPGPPMEIMAVWSSSLKTEFENLIPAGEREVLNIWRCLGKGESDIAELAEPIVKEAGLRVGYRAHAPYVEVKVWSKATDKTEEAFRKLDSILGPYTVNRNKDDLARDFLKACAAHQQLLVTDSATTGHLAERLLSIVRDEKSQSLSLTIVTSVGTPANGAADGVHLFVEANRERQFWTVSLSNQGKSLVKSEVKPIYNHKVESERGRKYICEKALQIALSALAKTV